MTGSPAGRTLCTHGEGWGLLQGEPEGKAAILGVEFSAEKEEDILPRDVCLRSASAPEGLAGPLPRAVDSNEAPSLTSLE